MTYKRYEKYKDSGSEWIGEVPINWYEKKLKYTIKTVKGFAFKSEVFKDNGRPIIKTTDIKQGGIVEPITFINENDANDYTSVMLKENDILMSTVGSKPEVINSAVGQIGLVSKAYEGSLLNQNAVILRPKIKDINNNLLFYYLSSNNYRKYLDLNAHGTANQSSLTLKEILDFTIVIPDIIEQNQVADFLDKKTTEIDSLIKDKEKLIEFLKEQRQAIITEAVTKGLDKNAAMKDSGVEWIGEIPNGWKTRRLKYNCYMKGRIGWQGLKQSEFIDEGPFLITGMNFKEGKINWDEVYHISEERYNEAPEIQLREGDVLITKDGTIGKVLFIDILPDKASLNSHLLVMRCKNNDFKPKYLYYSLQAEYFKMYVEQVKTGTTFFGITQEAMSNFPLILPPLNEQDKIVKAIESDLNKIDSLVDDVKIGINNLMEYKQSLISEVVTGKIDIREL